jgi:predicted DNA-binding transcriptional regulator AlpA
MTTNVDKMLASSRHPRKERPGATLIRKKELIKRVGVDPSTLWQWMRDGQFPRPRILNPGSRREIVGWIEADIEEWLATRPQRLATPVTEKGYEATRAKGTKHRLYVRLPASKVRKPQIRRPE